MAGQGVRTRPLRNGLTALSLLIGVLTVVLVQGSSEVIASATVHRALLAQGPATTVRVSLEVTPGDPDPTRWWRPTLARTVRATGGRVVSVAAYGPAKLTTGDGPMDVETVAISTDLRGVRPLEVLRGRWFTEAPYLVPEVLLNRRAGSRLVAGEVVTIGAGAGTAPVRARVRGVVEDGTDVATVYVRDRDRDLLSRAGMAPTSQAVLLTGGDERVLRGRVADLAAVAGRQSSVADVARNDTMTTFEDQLRTSRSLLLSIAALSLLVGTLGILNIGLATLRDRSEEWAIRRALGASRAHVLALVLVESQVVALAAAAVALVSAWFLVPWALGRMSDVSVAPVPLPWRAAALGVLASSSAAFIGAVAPALRTSRIALSSLLR
ncbi:ABC transporter permease [Intrasporangium sp.]|uniref:ABC transporter permease n=1 Tax=Intrasporangium sp. TaxID=1925024 RepID=UPI003221D2E8